MMYKLYTLVGILGFSLSACSLNEDLTSVYNADNAYTTEENAQEGVNGIYRYLLGATHPATFYINDMSTDDCYMSEDIYETLNENGLSSDVQLSRAYNGNWQMIGCANSAIDNIIKMPNERFKSVQKKNELLAEAYFMRAFAYYQLTNIFYRVPLITNGFYDSTANPKLSSIEALDDQIEKDLLIAANHLPNQWNASYEGAGGRPTKGAAYGYLMRLHMRKAGRLREEGQTNTSAWQAALTYANQVIATGKYALQPHIFDVFDPSSNEKLYNNEIIFAVRASENASAGASDLALYFTFWNYNYGWDKFNVPLEMYWKFNANDERLTKLLISSFPDVYNSNIVYKSPKFNEVGTLDNETSSPIVKELAQVYTDKYHYQKAGTYNYNTPNNLPLLRYADVLLCKAEILNELNGINNESIELLNKIRERAFQNSNHSYTVTDFSSADDFRNKLCDERLFELNNEGVRRIDLIRMGLWKDRLDTYMDGIKAKAEKQQENMNAKNPNSTPVDLSAKWKPYPKFSGSPLKKYDIRRYYPIPRVYSSKYPDLENNRSFIEQ